MRVTKDYVFFFTFKDVFSNWFMRDFWFKPEGLSLNFKFECMEQYMMWAKARLFKDYKVADQIFTKEGIRDGEKDQAFYKRMGRAVSDFDGEVWDANKEAIVKEGLRAKFAFGTNCRKQLLSYPGKSFVEASPYDNIYGIKMGMWDAGVEDSANWKGQNLLGKWITDIRDEIEGEVV